MSFGGKCHLKWSTLEIISLFNKRNQFTVKNYQGK